MAKREHVCVVHCTCTLSSWRFDASIQFAVRFIGPRSLHFSDWPGARRCPNIGSLHEELLSVRDGQVLKRAEGEQQAGSPIALAGR